MTTAPRPVGSLAHRTGPDGALLVPDLLLPAESLATLLAQARESGDWVDAYLAVAGLTQLVDDHCHPDPLQLRRTADYLAGRGPRAARWGAAATATAAELLRRGRGGRRDGLLDARAVLAELAMSLAAQVLHPGREVDRRRLADLAGVAPRCVGPLGGDVARPPACFRGFDQHPDDLRLLARAWLDHSGRPRSPVCVVGVRTSGSYLAPLLAAALQGEGTPRPEVVTHRPTRPFLAWERAILRDTVAEGGSVLVCDDPPGTGSTLAGTVRAVTGAGVPVTAQALVLAVFGDPPELPAALQGQRAVLLPWPAWSVHHRLQEDCVGPELARMLGARWRVGTVRRLGPSVGPTVRGHVRARYTVDLLDRHTGRTERRDLAVEGAGLGYLGRQALAVAEALGDHVPCVYGFSEGLLFREWLPDGPGAGEDRAGAEVVASYVADRARSLPVAVDPSPGLRGRDPVWEVAAELLARPYGPAAPFARTVALEPLTRRLLACERPSVVDGATELERWRPSAGSGRLRKVDFHQFAFSNTELSCYDQVFDLAGAAAVTRSPAFEAALRQAWEAGTGRRVDYERWLLYRLTHIPRLVGAGTLTTDCAARSGAAAVHDYLAGCYLRDLDPPAVGPWVAVDLDGVLETDRLGFPAASPAGVLALRALLAHGYRPALVTGRSLDDARHRCQHLGLAGAVAEYGLAAYDPRTGHEVDLRDAAVRELMGAVRTDLQARGLEVDAGHRYAVRVRQGGGPLRRDLERTIPLLREPDVRVVRGEGQTDVCARSLDKGTGLDHLMSGSGAWCALAVGDSASDLPMMERALMARAPRNADAHVRAAGVPVTRHAYQLGLLDACAALLGHRPGGCPDCRPPVFPPRTRAVLAVLGLPEGGGGTVPVRSLQLLAELTRRPSW
ncbi:MAG: HAD family hydrolase [Oryzihumus sp.]